MFVHERHAQILKRLQAKPRASVAQLQEELKLSRSTLRRDLMELEQRGEVLRVHGGVMLRAYLKGEPTFDRRFTHAMDAKQSMARRAAQLVPENATVYLDAGTTCLLLGRELLMREDLHLFTHSVSLLAEASGGLARITGIGGELRAVSQALIGGVALRWLQALRLDIGFLGASGLGPFHGASTTDLSEAAVKQHIIASCGQNILMADSTKWDCPAAVGFADWNQFDAWVTDEPPLPAAQAMLQQHDVRLIVADQESS